MVGDVSFSKIQKENEEVSELRDDFKWKRRASSETAKAALIVLSLLCKV